jgi:hypothetical protein
VSDLTSFFRFFVDTYLYTLILLLFNRYLMTEYYWCRGKRSCIGQNLAMLEMRVIASALVRNFDFQMSEKLDMELFVTVKPISLKMKVTKRC